MSEPRPHRLPGQPPDEWSDTTRAEFDATVQTGRSRPLHLPSVIAHHPTYLSAYLTWAKAVALDAVLPPGDEPSAADPTMVGQYAFMGVMETLGFARFFRDPVVAAVGGAAMLPVAVTAIARRLGG